MPGALLAVGNTSRVMRWGDGHVVKVLDASTPRHWAALEAEWTATLHAHGLPVPEVVDVTELWGRPAIVLSLAKGPTMLEAVLTGKDGAISQGRSLAELHHWLHSLEPPRGLPRLADRMVTKMHEASRLSDRDRQLALRQLSALPEGDRLCHGDLHPGNIILGQNGPLILDWFDVSTGHPLADVARTSIMIRPRILSPPPRYLPGSSNMLLEHLHQAYIASYLNASAVTAEEVTAWELPVAAARLCERGEHRDLEEIVRHAATQAAVPATPAVPVD